MSLDYAKLTNWPFKERVQTYSERDTILYALGLGLSMDPLDEEQLRFTYEKGLKALPTMAIVMGSPGMWYNEPGTGLDVSKILHGEQSVELHRPMPVAATVGSTNKVVEIIDKGADKGAILIQERELVNKDTGDKIATLQSGTFARGNGGFGGPSKGGRPPHQLPDREPDKVHIQPTLPQSALIYRLSGDDNSLHADPEVARSVGFKAPILHGLCTFGIAGFSVLKSFCDYNPELFKSMRLRFSSPVYPGETIVTEMWEDDGVVSFRSSVSERDQMVLNNGCVVLG